MAVTKINSPRGMRDILPKEASFWQYIEKKARHVFDKYFCEEVRTPILEETALFKRAIGEGTDIVNKEMYTFLDRGGRSLTLRPEGTAPIVRSYIENKMYTESLVKLFYIGPMFRAERPQKGRSRQFHQIGVEYIGESSYLVDVEAINMMVSFFNELPLKNYKIKMCSLGCNDDKKRLAQELRKFLLPEKNRLCDDCRVRLDKNVLRTLDCKVESCRAIMRTSPKAKNYLCQSCGSHYNNVLDVLSGQGMPVIEDLNMVRGLDYYTNTVFEVTHSGLGSQDALAAGGRYDNLIEDFGGKPTGAFGFAIGVERLLMALESENVKPHTYMRPDVYFVIPNGFKEAFIYAIKIRDALTENKLYCEMNLQSKSLKSQMRQADKKNARQVVILGEDEMKQHIAVVRDMDTSQQSNVPLADLTGSLMSKLKIGNGS